jgi:hypothetical protein
MLTQEQYEEAEHVIYNDLPSTILYPSTKVRSKFNQSVVDKILLPGEEYVKLKGEDDHMIYTSYARLINTNSIRVLKATFTHQNVLTWFRADVIRSIDMFKVNGWEHNVTELQERYIEKGWKYYLQSVIRVRDIEVGPTIPWKDR